MSLSRSLAALACARNAQSLPAAIIAKARLHVADAVAITLAATRDPMSSMVARSAASGSCGGDCTVIGSRRKLPPALAALSNAALGHLLDFDDIHDVARLHPTTVTLPSALAAADLVGARLDAVAKAVAIGNDLMCRLGVTFAPQGTGAGSDWFLTQLFGYFGSALSASLVLGASESEVASALGLAYMQAAGGKEAAFGVGSTARAIYPGFAAMGGMQAALLAHAGIAGPESAFDGEAGLFRIYLGGNPSLAARGRLLDASDWPFLDTAIKLWPSCRLSHPYVAAALAVRERMRNHAVRRAVVAVNASAAKLCRPLEQRRNPITVQDAKYSIPFMVAFALVHGKVNLATLNSLALHDTAVLDLAARIEIDERLPDNPGHPPAEVCVETTTARYESPRPIAITVSHQAQETKFVDCLNYAGWGAQSTMLRQRLIDSNESLSFLLAECRVNR